MDALRPEFDDRVAFVMADLSTMPGQTFSNFYGAGHTTLVFFDISGRRVGTLYGVQNEQYLRRYIDSMFPRIR